MSTSSSRAKNLRPVAVLAAIAAIAATPAPPARKETPAPAARPAAATTPPPARPLQSWKESPAKRALQRFLKGVETSGNPGTAPADVRVAVFATEGVLWDSGVVSLEDAWALDRLRSLAPTKPEWATTPPFSALLGNDPGALAALSAADLAILTATALGGLDQDEIRTQVLAWVRTAPPGRHAPADRARPAMRELLELLRTWNFRSYVVSDGPAEVTRALVEALYDLPAYRVIAPLSQIEVRDQGVRTRFVFSGEPAPPPSGASRLRTVVHHLGVRPLLVAGAQESDGPLLEWAAGRKAPFIALGFRGAGAPSGSRIRPLPTEVLGGRWTVVTPSESWLAPPGRPAAPGR
ncbi:MAG: haloacid dehalogenase-like hydrolase [Holophagales bacterium]|nr:haloacid dehalogenase-like hydrolase [Holophagales bacterium]